MAPPSHAASGTYLTGNSGTTAAIAVPTGVVSGSFIFASLYLESSAAVTMPTGFAEAPNSPQSCTAPDLHYAHLYWKRATASDAGTYSFSWTGSSYREGIAMRLTNVYPVGDPWDVTTGAARSSDDTLSPAISFTTTMPDTLWIYNATNFAGGAWTSPAPGGLIDRTGGATSDIGLWTIEQASKGGSGSLSATNASSSFSTSWMGALKGIGATPNPTPMVMKQAVSRASYY